MSYEAKLVELGITLPPPPKPVATYIPAVLTGQLLFLSGVVPFRDGKLVLEGKLGKGLTVEQGYEAARIALLNALAIVRSELGSLDRVAKVVRLIGYVASAEGLPSNPRSLMVPPICWSGFSARQAGTRVLLWGQRGCRSMRRSSWS